MHQENLFLMVLLFFLIKLVFVKLYIKNMVCGRCKLIVKTELEKLGFSLRSIELGEVEIIENINTVQKKQIAEILLTFGFELIDNERGKTIEKIKNLIRELVHEKNNELVMNLSDYLSKNLNTDYGSISNLFSETEGITVEKFFIFQKIERVKELLMYNEMTLSEISYTLNYSSVAYLSNQFKKITGLTPSHFKNLKNKKRKNIDEL